MPHWLRLLFFFFLAGATSACSLTQNIASTSSHPELSKKQDAGLSFIDGISRENQALGNPENSSLSKIEEPRLITPAKVEKKIAPTDYQQQFSAYLEVPPLEVMKNKSIWFFIDRWWGTPYKLGGTDFNGVDCSAFTQRFYKDIFKSFLPRTAQEQFNSSEITKNLNNLHSGDLVFFKIRSRKVSHVGIYLQNGKFVNASSSYGVSIGDLNHPYWKRYFVGGGHPANEDLTSK